MSDENKAEVVGEVDGEIIPAELVDPEVEADAEQATETEDAQ